MNMMMIKSYIQEFCAECLTIDIYLQRQEVVHEKVENGGGRRKTLDSRFAIMKEQRKTYQSNNNYSNEVQVSRLPPWARARRFLR